MSVGLVLIGTYLIVVLVIGVWAYRRWPTASLEDYLLADRGTGWVLAGFALMATQYSALTIQGFPANMFQAGLPAFIAITGFAIFPYALLWSLWAPRVWKLGRRYGHMTAADLLRDYFDDERVGYLLSAVMFLAIIPYLQIQLIGAGFLFNVATAGAVSVELGGIILYVVVIAYTLLGGMRGLIYTDFVQGLLLTIGVVATAWFAVTRAGGGVGATFATALAQSREYFVIPGVTGQWTWAFLLTWMLVLGLGISSHAHLWLRMHIARDLRLVRAWPAWLTLSFWVMMLLGFLIATAAVGVLDPDAVTPDSMVPEMAARFGGTVTLALLATAGIAAMMSSLDSQAHALGGIVVRDWLMPLRPNTTARGAVVATRWTVTLAASVALALSLAAPQLLVFLAGFSASLGAQIVPPMLAVVLGASWVTRQGVTAALLAGSIAVVVFGFGPLANVGGVYGGFSALVVNAGVLLAVSAMTDAKPSRETVTRFQQVGW